MEENPYRSPVEIGAQGSRLRGQLLTFAVGAILLAPACWALGRALIPPDGIALRFSVIVYVPTIALGLAYSCLRETIETSARMQLTAFAMAVLCFVDAVVLRLVWPGNWLDGGWICLSIGAVAFMVGTVSAANK